MAILHTHVLYTSITHLYNQLIPMLYPVNPKTLRFPRHALCLPYHCPYRRFMVVFSRHQDAARHCRTFRSLFSVLVVTIGPTTLCDNKRGPIRAT
jgi:hypothetical protein